MSFFVSISSPSSYGVLLSSVLASLTSTVLLACAVVLCRLFYFFFESRGHKDDPVVIWLTGGPGCSSELALFYENGPFHIAGNLSLVWNDFGWDKVYIVLLLRLPI